LGTIVPEIVAAAELASAHAEEQFLGPAIRRYLLNLVSCSEVGETIIAHGASDAG
jgi:hypothetical protein